MRERPGTNCDDLNRFLDAQRNVFDGVESELRAGRKTSHWMWFVFPQLRGLGQSPLSEKFAICDIDEARAYLEHPVLGSRLRECTRLVNAIEGRSVRQIFGYPDYLKFRSCMTLFRRAGPSAEVFATALEKYFDGDEDPRTLELLFGAQNP
ncbi:MAG: DUF1810 domain-containing protein [Gammaproteobacteria bacterium]|jgi:uncharacterized protein (DUF1810 family)